MKNTSKYLFVYGTLLSRAQNVFSSFLVQNSKPFGHGYFQGELFLIDWYPGVIKSEKPEDKVVGQIVEIIGNIEDVLNNLDEYEGISQPPQPSDEYTRVLDTIFVDDKPLDCWIYLYQGQTKDLQKITSGDFVRFQKERKML